MEAIRRARLCRLACRCCAFRYESTGENSEEASVSLSSFLGAIAISGGCQWESLFRLFQEVFNDWDYPFRLGRRGKMAGVGYHGKLGIRDEPYGLNGMLDSHEIVISKNDKHLGLDGSQLLFRKAGPLNVANLVINPGPVIWIGRNPPVVFSLKLDVAGIGRRRMLEEVVSGFRASCAGPKVAA